MILALYLLFFLLRFQVFIGFYSFCQQDSDDPNTDSSDEEGKSSLDKRKKALIARFSRDAFRTSLSNRPEMFAWLEAQEHCMGNPNSTHIFGQQARALFDKSRNELGDALT